MASSDALTADASAARTIGLHLTPFAPLAEKWGIGDPRRWKTFCMVTPDRAVRSALTRLRRAPGDVRAEIYAPADDVALMAVVEGFGAEPGGRQPMAVFHDGLTLDETRAVLAQLTRAGWTPAAIDGGDTTPFVTPNRRSA